MADLPLVLEGREHVRPPEQLDVGLGVVAPDLVDEVLEPDHDWRCLTSEDACLRRWVPAGRAETLRPRGAGSGREAAKSVRVRPPGNPFPAAVRWLTGRFWVHYTGSVRAPAISLAHRRSGAKMHGLTVRRTGSILILLSRGAALPSLRTG